MAENFNTAEDINTSPDDITTKNATRRSGAKAKIESGKQRAREATETVRRKLDDVADAGVTAVEGRPLTALAGAIAVGAAAAALIPVTRREQDVVGPLGAKARGAIDQAMQSAKVAGIDHLTAQGLTSAALSSGVGGIIGAIVKSTLAASAMAEPQAEPKARTKDEPSLDLADPA